MWQCQPVEPRSTTLSLWPEGSPPCALPQLPQGWTGGQWPAWGGAEGMLASGSLSVGLQGVSAVPRPSQGSPREPQPCVPWLWPGRQLGLGTRRGASGACPLQAGIVFFFTHFYFLPFPFVFYLYRFTNRLLNSTNKRCHGISWKCLVVFHGINWGNF